MVENRNNLKSYPLLGPLVMSSAFGMDIGHTKNQHKLEPKAF